MRLIPLFLLLLVLPLGVAAQNSIAVLVSLIFALMIFRGGESYSFSFFQSKKFGQFLTPLICSIGFLLWLCIATALNPDHPTGAYFKFVGGHTVWILLPCLAVFVLRGLTPSEWRRLLKLGSLVAGVWGLVTVSQYLIGWRVVGVEFVSGPTRSQGFYSHPLTLAYTAVLLFPFAAYKAISTPRDFFVWPLFLGACALIFTSQSRMIQLVAGLVFLFNVLYFGRGRARVMFIAAMLVGGSLVALTDNKIRTRFLQTIDLKHDRHTDYPDDRMAFWEVHMDMFNERPVLGHGNNLNSAYRTVWYDAAGYEYFHRKYPAHNMFLQVAVNGGLIGLAFFVCWWGHYFLWGWKNRLDAFSNISLQTFAGFCLASLTQNSFQDSEVRFALTLLILFVWLYRYQRNLIKS